MLKPMRGDFVETRDRDREDEHLEEAKAKRGSV
jgi:hypothetical protein